MPSQQAPSRHQFQTAQTLLLLAAGWLVPGCGYFLLSRRHWGRGLLYLVLIHLTFGVGVLLRGGVVWPAWRISDAGFSIVNNLTFLIQLGAGWLSLASLAASQAHWAPLAAVESYAYFELGSFYCLVAGAMNYFIVSQSLGLAGRKAFETLAKQ